MKVALAYIVPLLVVIGPARGQVVLPSTNAGGQVLYGIGGPSNLVRIDPTTLTVTFVGDTGFLPTSSLAISRSTLFFATHNDPRRSGPELIQINPLTGVGTAVSPVNSQLGGISGMAFDGAGTLFGVTFSRMLVTIDTSTGAVSTVGPNGIAPTAHIHDIAFRPFGVLFGVTFDPGDPTRGIPSAPQQLVRIDVTTGHATTIGVLSPPFPDVILGLAFDASARLFGTGTSLFQIDPTTAAVTVLGSIVPPAFPVVALDFTPGVIFVSIDIKPGSFPNTINLGSGGTLPVAIFSTTTFDATTVNPMKVTLAGSSVKLKGQGTPMASFQDVNGDGLLDLLVHVTTDTLQFTDTDTEVVLEGQTFGGTLIRGADTVRVVP